MHRTWAILTGLWLSLGMVLPGGGAQAGSAEVFQKEIQPIIEKHCYECHGPEKHKGDLNLAAFTSTMRWRWRRTAGN